MPSGGAGTQRRQTWLHADRAAGGLRDHRHPLGVAVANFRRSIVKAKEAVLPQDLHTMSTLINQYFADKGKYPSDLTRLVDDHYLQAIPKDPFTDSADSWITEEAEMDESDISAEPGIANVKSGAEGTSLDGRSYGEFLTGLPRVTRRTGPCRS
jgi:general secretion pathway protein G